MVRSGFKVRVQPPSWTWWWCRSHSGKQIVEVRGAEVFPPGDVMDAAVLEPDLTAGEPTGPVHRPQRPALFGGGETPGPTQVQRDAVLVEGDGGDGGVAAQPADGLDG